MSGFKMEKRLHKCLVVINTLLVGEGGIWREYPTLLCHKLAAPYNRLTCWDTDIDRSSISGERDFFVKII